jgi:hypothetical protein
MVPGLSLNNELDDCTKHRLPERMGLESPLLADDTTQYSLDRPNLLTKHMRLISGNILGILRISRAVFENPAAFAVGNASAERDNNANEISSGSVLFN